MKKPILILLLSIFSLHLSAQYLIVGKDSISLSQFEKDNDYGLKNNGIDKTLRTTEDFLLIQQFAQSKKVDTLANFRSAMMQKQGELVKKYFYPKSVTNPLLQDYVNSNKTERQVQIFFITKTKEDNNDYKKVYDEVKSGKMTMEDAIKKYTKNNGEPIFVKPGVMDNTLYAEIKTLPKNGYTKLINNENFIAFAKALDTRPSLGYVVFGSLSYSNDEKAAETKANIDKDFKAGKKFEEVAKNNGSNDNEKNNGGLIIGSPTLPDEIYNALKGQKVGYTTPPILKDNRYYIFHIYQITPYELNEKTEDFFFQDMQNSLYSEILQDKMIAYVKSQPGFKEFPAFQNLKKSYQNYLSTANKPGDILFQYNGIKTTFEDIKKVIDPHKDEASKFTDKQWGLALDGLEEQNLLRAYGEDLARHDPMKSELEQARKILYSDYVFSKYMREEMEAHPELIADYYNKNKSNYVWDTRAKGRVAIIADPKLVADVKKEIKDPKNWESLKKKYDGKLNDKNQVLVHFEEGEMAKEADVFTKYKVPFELGVHQTRMGDRDLIIAIDKILPPTQMTLDEAKDSVKEQVTEQLLKKITDEQRAKTKIIVEPNFLKELEKKFKK